MLSLRIQKLGDATVIRCAGRITFSYADALRIAVLRQPRIQTVVLDLADIIAVDAAGLGILVSLRAWSRETGTALKLMNLTPKVEELLELTHLKSAFEVCSAREMLDLLCRAIHQAESVAIRTSDSGLKRQRPDPLRECTTLGTRPGWLDAYIRKENTSAAS